MRSGKKKLTTRCKLMALSVRLDKQASEWWTAGHAETDIAKGRAKFELASSLTAAATAARKLAGYE